MRWSRPSRDADLVLIRLNTPGGLMDAMRQTIEKIVASPVPVVTYVSPSGGRAASAGFFLLLSADVAAMAPGTNTGAASPVLLAGEMDAVMRKKVENDAAASLRSLAAKRGRNSALAEKAVLESKSFTDKEALDNQLDRPDRARSSRPVAAAGRPRDHPLRRPQAGPAAGRRRVDDYELTWREQLVKAISDPNIALILLVLGALGVYIEFSSPGLILPGVAGGILVLLGLSALSVLPINWMGAALLLLAVALVHPGSEVRLPRHPGRGRSRRHDSGRGAAGGQPHPRNANSLDHRHRPHPAFRHHYRLSAVADPAGQSQ